MANRERQRNGENQRRYQFPARRGGDDGLRIRCRGPQEGKYYDWPVGFHQGARLADFWRLEDHTPGETSFTHFADGTAHKNRMQGNDYVQSQMYKRA